MKTFIKTGLIIFTCGLCMSAMAANRFIVKYKPTEAQTSYLLARSGIDEKKAKAQIREQMMERISKEKVDALSRAAGVQVKDSHAIATGAHVIILNGHLDEKQTEQFIRNVKQDNSIEYIEEDLVVHAASVPSINPARQWDMTNAGGFSPQPTWSGDNFVNAWNALDSYGYIPGNNVVVAVVDTGYTPHPNFINNLQPLNGQTGVYGYTFISDCRNSGTCPASTADSAATINYVPDGLDLGDFITAQDITNPHFATDSVSNSSWHGSHCTGTIIGSGYNGVAQTGISGGAYGATVVPVRVLGKGGGTGYNSGSGYVSDVIQGMSWATGQPLNNVDGTPIPVNANPANVISMSLGGQGQCGSAYQDAINTITAEGVIIVVAAGNSHDDIAGYSPASCSDVISVAAKGPTNDLTFYSNYGATTITASGGEDPTFSNPLPQIYSTVWSSSEAYQNTLNGGSGIWEGMQGTSQATPHVSAAVAALISVFKAQGKTYTIQEIISILQTTATTMNNPCSSYGCATNFALDANALVFSVCSPCSGQCYIHGNLDTCGMCATCACNALAPTLTNVTKSGYEGNVVTFALSDFTNNFSGCGSLVSVEITSLPTNGTLKLSGFTVAVNQAIAASNLSNLTYTPNTGYIGSDGFGWNGSDGTMYAAGAANVDITIQTPTVSSSHEKTSSSHKHGSSSHSTVSGTSSLEPPLYHVFKKVMDYIK